MLKRPAIRRIISRLTLKRGFAGSPEPSEPPKPPKKTQWDIVMNTITSVRLHGADFYYKHKMFSTWLVALAATGTLFYIFAEYLYQEKSFSEFLSSLEKGEIESMKVRKYFGNGRNTRTVVLYKAGSMYHRTQVIDYNDFISTLSKAMDFYPEMKVTTTSSQEFLTSLTLIESLSLSVLIFWFALRFRKSLTSPNNDIRSRASVIDEQITKNKARKFTKETDLGIRFDDVAGMKQAKLEIMEFVEFLKHPDRFLDIGAKIPKGALLAGPPGTGKTLLAKACAGEAEVPFFYVSGSEFVELFVGLGASRVRDLFEEAKKSSPCIIFIDEVDAIGKKRSENFGASSESDSTLNQILVEMDGFGTDSKVVIFAATNRKELLDEALTRPGRFDRSIDVTLPDLEGRAEIFKVHLKKIKLGENTMQKHANRLAALTPGFSGAEIANICNEAAIQAVRAGKSLVEEHEFEIAVERVIGGIEKKRSENMDDRRIVAVHESGHGAVSWFLEGAAPLLKLTIIPRSKGALGFAQYLPNEISLETRDQIEDKIVAVLAGRCAEEEFFGRVTTGAFDDLQKATRMARSIVTQLGMSTALANIAHEENEYGGKAYSDMTAAQIDDEIQAILDNCTQRCRELVKKHKNKIQSLSEELLVKETIGLRDITRILGERPFPPHEGFKAYLEHS